MSKFECDMSEQLSVFDDNTSLSFDDFSRENGITYWLASDLAIMLGYKDMQSVNKAINKATSVCIGLNIPISENFIQIATQNTPNDFKLTRGSTPEPPKFPKSVSQ